MTTLTEDLTRRLRRIPAELKAEFPDVELDAIERDVDQSVRELSQRARFNDFVPLLVHKAVRERLRARHAGLTT
ncbi:MAG TPA: DUF3562 domain-containing protein [Gaiellaceae bacterium]|nr:DUF3562 domain-containing protein [Gaiellaceae bacterium]